MSDELVATGRIAAQVILVLTFVTAAIPKLRHAREFVGVLDNYQVLPAWAVEPVARVLPWIELVVATCLLVAPITGAAGAAILLIIFSACIAVNIKRGRAHIDCGCGQGVLTQQLRWALVWRNAALLLLTALVAQPGSLPEPLAVFTAIACGLAMTLLLISANSLLAFKPARKRRRIHILGDRRDGSHQAS